VVVLTINAILAALFALSFAHVAAAPSHAQRRALAAARPARVDSSSRPNFGPNVIIFNPRMSIDQIQATVDKIAAKQVPSEFGSGRYALLFEPGTYGTSAAPLNFQAGYYTTVAGLGRNPGDAVINGSIDVYNQCYQGTYCSALVNFWRSLSNLTINVSNASFACHSGEFWAVSQGSPIRRVRVNGFTTLMDYCSPPSYGSGGFIADSVFTGSTILSGSQQQWITRNSNIRSWTNGVWNQVFSGVVGAPSQCFSTKEICGGPYTAIEKSPVTREEPYLFVDSGGNFSVFVPAVERDSSGASWINGPTPGTAIPIRKFFIAQPDDSVEEINAALQSGKNLILTPGIYKLSAPIVVQRADTVVLGLGFPTLVPQNGNASMKLLRSKGVLVSGIIFDAGPKNSSVLLEAGTREPRTADADSASDPSAIQDVFFRIGGASAGSAADSLVVNSDNLILDDVWAWRADHGAGVGWTVNMGDTGIVVNGENVIAYGLFVEHYQKTQVIWNGNGGAVVFFQNEMPYDPPSQSAWMEAPGVDGYPAFKVADAVSNFHAYGMGSYSFFNQGAVIFAAHAFEAPATLAPGSMKHLFTIFLSTKASGGIRNVINNTGGSSTIANPDTPVTVVSYP